MRLSSFALVAVFAASSGARAADLCAGAAAIDVPRELFVTDPAVVADARAEPGGPWHFSSVMKRLLPTAATDKDASDLILGWLRTWDAEQRLVPDATKPASPANPERKLAKRPGVYAKIAGAWLTASQKARADAGEPEDGTLKLALAPFALRAIVYRPDRRDRTRCATSAGEGRFLFAALPEPTLHPTTVPLDDVLQMTVIFEFDLPVTAHDARGWAGVWHKLGAESCASAADCDGYRKALESLTAQFSIGPLLAQLRTNEIIAFPSELRQFALVDATTGRKALVNAPVSQTPDLSLNNAEALATWVNDNRAAILKETHVLPPNLIGMTAPVPRATRWKLPATVDEELRFKLSKNTCNGCHGFEREKIPDVDGLWQFAPDGRISDFLKEQDLPARAAEVCALLNAADCRDE